MLDVIFLLLVSFGGPRFDMGLASVYGGPGDAWSGDVAADGQPLRLDGVAHRSWPIGTRVTVCRVGRKVRCAPAVVRDRGPYGCVDDTGRWAVASGRPRRCPAGWRFRGVLDMTPSVAAAVGVSGLSQVVVLERSTSRSVRVRPRSRL